MALVPVELPESFPSASPEVGALIADAQSRIETFVEFHRDRPIPAFVPSDFALTWDVLRHVARTHLAPGLVLCEWGSGAGVVACLAAMAGFDACGIEIEAELVDLSRSLAADHKIDVTFYRGNFVPHAGQQIAEQTGEFAWLAVGGADPYAEMEMDIDDFDAVFAYPWPGEQRVIERLFDRFAAEGALLVTYNGTEGAHIFRKRFESKDW